MAMSIAAALVVPATLTRFDAVGWGFDSHGGFPAVPWGSFVMNKSTTAYFVGNASGMDSGLELTLEAKLGYVGIGWQINNIPSNDSHLEKYEIEEARNLKSLRPDIKVGVLRNTEVTTVFWDSARAIMFNASTQDYWTQCDGKPCVGSWGSPAGNTPKYWFNFSNPKMADWWVNEYVGQAANNKLFDGVYFDCSCGTPMGVPPSELQQFKADAQKTFDRGLELIKSTGKWASAWNSNGQLSQESCSSTIRSWISIGQNSSLGLQVLAPAFHKNPVKEALRSSATQCGSCNMSPGMDAISSGIITPPINGTTEQECCALCKGMPKCEAFVMGRCDPGDPGCVNWANKTAVACFLVDNFRGFRSNSRRSTGCIREAPSPPPVEAAQNITVAAFLISRGQSAMLEFPVVGAYEDMRSYDLDSPLLNADYGVPVGPASEVESGVFTRKWSKVTVTLNCNSYNSSIVWT